MRNKFLTFFIFFIFFCGYSCNVQIAHSETSNFVLISTYSISFYDNNCSILYSLPNLEYTLNPPLSHQYEFLQAKLDVQFEIISLNSSFSVTSFNLSMIDEDTSEIVPFYSYFEQYYHSTDSGTYKNNLMNSECNTTRYLLNATITLANVQDYSLSVSVFAQITYIDSVVWVNVLLTNITRFIKVFLIFLIAFLLKREFGSIAFPVGLLLGAIVFYIGGVMSIFETLIMTFISILILYEMIKKKKTERLL